MSYEEEDTCMSVKEEDTCESSKTSNTSAKHTRSEPSRLPGRPPEGPAGGAPGGVPRSADFLRDRYLRDFWIFLLFLSYEEEDTYLADGRAEILRGLQIGWHVDGVSFLEASLQRRPHPATVDGLILDAGGCFAASAYFALVCRALLWRTRAACQ